MPRMARVVVVLRRMPDHAVPRGHNRRVVSARAEDYEPCLGDLRELGSPLDIRVCAYCLMTNHVHLSLGPGDEVATTGWRMQDPGGSGHALSQLAGRPFRYGVGGARKVQPGADVEVPTLAHGIELNPVRARMVSLGGVYPWSI